MKKPTGYFDKFTKWHLQNDLLNRNDGYVEFPVEWSQEHDGCLTLFLEKHFASYRKELELFFNDCPLDNVSDYMYSDLLGKVDALSAELIKIAEVVFNYHDSINTYEVDNEYPFMLGLLKGRTMLIDNEVNLFRGRNIICSEITNFYHCPFDNHEANLSDRFASKENPCWYFSYSFDACKKEVCSQVGTCGELRVKDTCSILDVVDLTLRVADCSDSLADARFLLWPLLFSIYIIDDNNIGYKLSQYISKILRSNSFNGIRYYSCRNINLNPLENYYKNLVLFVRPNGSDKYDADVVSKFELVATRNFKE